MWDAADAYEEFMGRWSAAVAHRLFDDVALPRHALCLDLGCGVGSLSRVVIERLQPDPLVGVDASAAFVGHAASVLPRLRAVQADGTRLPFAEATFDAVASGLVLNHIPAPREALAEVARVLRPGGVLAAYVWDYDHPDFFLTRLWESLAVILGERAPGDERGRWRVCTSEGLAEAVDGPEWVDVQVAPIVVETRFVDPQSAFDGFLRGVGPSGHAVLALDSAARDRVRQHFTADLPQAEDGSVELTARALSVAATRR